MQFISQSVPTFPSALSSIEFSPASYVYSHIWFNDTQTKESLN